MRRGRRAAAEAGDRNKWEEEVVAGGTGGGEGWEWCDEIAVLQTRQD